MGISKERGRRGRLALRKKETTEKIGEGRDRKGKVILMCFILKRKTVKKGN